MVSIRMGGTLSKRAKNWTKRVDRERHLVCIEDPFELAHDLGRNVDWLSIQHLREEFNRAAAIMTQVRSRAGAHRHLDLELLALCSGSVYVRSSSPMICTNNTLLAFPALLKAGRCCYRRQPANSPARVRVKKSAGVYNAYYTL